MDNNKVWNDKMQAQPSPHQMFGIRKHLQFYFNREWKVTRYKTDIPALTTVELKRQ